MIAKDEFIAQAERNAANLFELPVTWTMLGHLVAELKQGEPRWWKQIAEAWKNRKFVQWTEASNLFITALHFEALRDDDNPLADYFPSCGGKADADPTEALIEFLEDPPERFYNNLKLGQRRFYAPAVGGLWQVAALLSFQARRLPFYLVEINAGAGLNLIADAVVPAPGMESELVQSRLGFDPAPLDVDAEDQAAWLAASVYPDHPEAIRSVHAAIETRRDIRAQNPEAIQLFKSDTALAPQYIAKNVPADDPGVGLLVHHYMATSRMVEEDYKAFSAQMLDLLKPWGDRGVWLEVENPRGESFCTKLQYRLHRAVDGSLKTHEMGLADFAAKKE